MIATDNQSQTMHFVDAFTICPSEDAIKNINFQMMVYEAVYNNCLYHVQHSPESGSPSTDFLEDFIKRTCTHNNPLYWFVSKEGGADELIVRGAILDFQQDMSNFTNFHSIIQEKHPTDTIRKVSIYLEPEYLKQDLNSNILSLTIPVFGELGLAIALTATNALNLRDSPTSKTIKIEVVYHAVTQLYQVLIHKLEIVEPDYLIEDPNKIGIYVNEDPRIITLSNGTSLIAPSDLSGILNKMQDLVRSYKDPNTSSSKKKNLIIKLRITNDSYNAVLRSWFIRESDKLALTYNNIYVENQPRITRLFLLPEVEEMGLLSITWLQFVSQLYIAAKRYNKRLQTVYKSMDNVNRCNKCGTLYTNIPVYNGKWICRCCKTIHDVRINAAKNVLKSKAIDSNYLNSLSQMTYGK